MPGGKGKPKLRQLAFSKIMSLKNNLQRSLEAQNAVFLASGLVLGLLLALPLQHQNGKGP
jgi:hypothetical protein